jgi:hypothetical protein
VNAQLVAALVVLLVVASGVPLGRLACRRELAPLRRHPRRLHAALHHLHRTE